MTGTGIVADVGGTTTQLSLAVGGRLAGDLVSFATPSPRRDALTPERAADALLDKLAQEAGRLRAGCNEVRSLAVALGAVVKTDGIVRNASTLWLAPLAGLDVRGELARRLPWAEVLVLNDVAAAAWHYRSYGRFALVTVSTGLAFRLFDDGAGGLLTDPAGLSGESGHTPADVSRLDALPGGARAARTLGPAAAAGDPAARAVLDDLDLPWCECGAVADLCSYSSGPAAVRAAIRRARRDPEVFAASALHKLAAGDPQRIDAYLIAKAAGQADPFTLALLGAAVRPLAARLLALAADLGLRKVVIVGGFAHGVGEPWFTALRTAIGDLAIDAGWFSGWAAADFAGFLVIPDDSGTGPIAGMAAYAHAVRGRVREAVKPVGQSRLAVRSVPRPVCGREQFVVRVAFAGICATDLQILSGKRGCEPGIPGHECVGRVVEAGPALAGLVSVGDVVGLNPNRPDDEHGKLGHDEPGVFRDAFTGDLGLIARGQVIRLPEAGLSEWILLEMLAGVVRAQRFLGDLTGRSLLIVGAGVAGMLHVLAAGANGAGVVLVANRGRPRLDDAVRRGLVPAGNVLRWDTALPAKVRARTGGRGADAAVIAVTGMAGQDAASLIWPALAPDAAVHLFGGFPAGTRLRIPGSEPVDVDAIRSGRRQRVAASGRRSPVVLCGSRGGRHGDFAAARDMCSAGGLDVAGLISHVISLDALPAVAVELASRGTAGGALARRVVIDMRLTGEVVAPVTGRPPRLTSEALA
ncbi:MAG TPA: ROK family protein [Streptosporangiaceae bacterium]|nr:ROK family protein [Streptosporangiaceae bacterium]